MDMDDVVCVIETDKVSVDVRAPHAGKLVGCFGEPDDVIEVRERESQREKGVVCRGVRREKEGVCVCVHA